jgi:ribose 5-phosphate isomerase B
MPNKPLICLGTDHAGFALKEEIKKHLIELGYEVKDFGANAVDPGDDYPDFIIPAAEAVAKSGGEAVGIVFGGSGIGECMAANKVQGVRAATAYDAYTTSLSRQHNDANILCLGGRTATSDPEVAKRLVRIWLETPFTNDERHVRRLKEVTDYETRKQKKKEKK